MIESNFRFLIVGAGRGGTSLLMALLDYHSQLEVASEFRAQSHLMGRDFNCEKNTIIPDRINAFIDLCNKESKKASAKYWGNKITTEQIRGLEDHNENNPQNQKNIFELFFNQFFRETKIIFILRDGRACVNSKVNRTGQSMQTACQRWSYSVSMYKYLDTYHKNSICIKFEELLFSPEDALTQICKFLEIEYESNMLNGVASKKLMPEYQNTEFVKDKASTIELPKEYLALIEDDLKHCGYL